MLNRSLSVLCGATVFAALVVGAGGAGAQDYPKTHLKVIGPWSNSTTWTLNAQPFFERELPQATKGQITTDLTSMTEMNLKGPEMFRLVKIGVADMATTVTSYVAGEVPEVDGYDLAGVIQDVPTLRKALDVYNPVMDKIMSQRVGVRMITIWPTVAQVFWCAVPIGGFDDLKGKKVRTLGASQAEFVEAVGGAPVTMAFSEVVPALQRKVIDCAITGTLSGNIAKWTEVTTHLYPVNTGWSLWLLTANAKNWDRFAPKAREAILTSLDGIMVKRAWYLAEVGGNQGVWCSTGNPKCDKKFAEENKMTFTHLKEVPYTSADDQKRKELVQSAALPKFAKRCGPDCVKVWNDTIGKVVGLTAKAGT